MKNCMIRAAELMPRLQWTVRFQGDGVWVPSGPMGWDSELPLQGIQI